MMTNDEQKETITITKEDLHKILRSFCYDKYDWCDPNPFINEIFNELKDKECQSTE